MILTVPGHQTTHTITLTLSILLLMEDTILQATNSSILLGLWRLYSTMVRLMIIWAMSMTLQVYELSTTDQSRNVSNTVATGGNSLHSVTFYDTREKNRGRRRNPTVQSAVRSLQEQLHGMVHTALTLNLSLSLTDLRSYPARQMQKERKWFLTIITTSKSLVSYIRLLSFGTLKPTSNHSSQNRMDRRMYLESLKQHIFSDSFLTHFAALKVSAQSSEPSISSSRTSLDFSVI
jgi:hypothetical protein